MTNLDAESDDRFHGDNLALISSIKALLILDQKGTLVPHGIGGLARDLLHSASIRLARAEAEGKTDEDVAHLVEEVAKVLSGAPFPSARSYAKAREVVDLFIAPPKEDGE